MKTNLIFAVLLSTTITAPAHAGWKTKLLLGAAVSGGAVVAQGAYAKQQDAKALPTGEPAGTAAAAPGAPAQPAPNKPVGPVQKGADFVTKGIPDRPECKTFKDQIQVVSSGSLSVIKKAMGIHDIKKKAKAAGCGKPPKV